MSNLRGREGGGGRAETCSNNLGERRRNVMKERFILSKRARPRWVVSLESNTRWRGTSPWVRFQKATNRKTSSASSPLRRAALEERKTWLRTACATHARRLGCRRHR